MTMLPGFPDPPTPPSLIISGIIYEPPPLPDSWILVMHDAMSEEDQTTYATYPAKFGRCAFTGRMGLCKIVPRDDITFMYTAEQVAIARKFTRTATFLNTVGDTSGATVFDIQAAAMGRPTEESLYEAATYEDASATHPTVEDVGATPEELVTALAARLVPRR